MERRLNDAFDPTERRIEIVNAVQYEGFIYIRKPRTMYFFQKHSGCTGDENPLYLRTEAELHSEYDFIVRIPGTSINMHQLRAEIDFIN